MNDNSYNNVIITISLSIDYSLRDTLQSITDSGANKYFDVIIKLGSEASEMSISNLRDFCTGLSLYVHILTCPDEGIYSAMNQSLVYASKNYSGYCWFVNAGDLCALGIKKFEDYLQQPNLHFSMTLF